MTTADVQRTVDEIAAKYPPLLTLEEAALIARCPVGTLHDWSGRGLLDEFKTKPGRRVLLIRDRFVRFVLSAERP